MASSRLLFVVLLQLATASAKTVNMNEEVTATTPDGRTLHPTRKTLEAFKTHDTDRDGWITRKELTKRWLDLNVVGWKYFDATELGEAMLSADEEADTIMHSHDVNQDNKLDLHEYMNEIKPDL